jgi:NADPH:quinone reductase-like Zn-dependent oxidoreductase
MLALRAGRRGGIDERPHGGEDMILVVGATGQLGTAVIRKLTAMGQKVRAFVRPGSRHQHLEA